MYPGLKDGLLCTYVDYSTRKLYYYIGRLLRTNFSRFKPSNDYQSFEPIWPSIILWNKTFWTK